MKKYLPLIVVLLIASSLASCSDTDTGLPATTNPTLNYDPDMTLVYDGETLGVYDVQATFDSDNKIYEYSAMLSNGRKMWMGFTSATLNGIKFDIVAYLRISNPDGSDQYSALNHVTDRYLYFEIDRYENSAVKFEFSGKIYADANNPNSASHYLTGFSKIHYTAITPGINNIGVESLTYGLPWKVTGWEQLSPVGAPIELRIWGFPNHEFRLFFDAVPAVGYYGFNNNSTGYKVIFSFYDRATGQYQSYNCSGVMHVSEVFSNPKRIKGEFSLTGDRNINGITFDCRYN